MISIDQARSDLEDFMADYFQGVKKEYIGAPEVVEAAEHAILGGGSRWRPLMVYGGAFLNGADEEKTTRLAAAIEFIHGASLIKDDSPAFDNSPLRRGKETAHAKYGVMTADLAFTALLEWSTDIINRNSYGNQTKFILIARKNAMDRTISGEYRDTKGVRINSEKDAVRLYADKTGALFAAAAYIGGVIGNAEGPQLRLLENLGLAVGISYQAGDDLYDALSQKAELGKPVQKDSATQSPLSVLGQGAVRRIRQYYDRRAEQHLRKLSGEKKFLEEVVHEIKALHKAYVMPVSQK